MCSPRSHNYMFQCSNSGLLRSLTVKKMVAASTNEKAVKVTSEQSQALKFLHRKTQYLATVKQHEMLSVAPFRGK